MHPENTHILNRAESLPCNLQSLRRDIVYLSNALFRFRAEFVWLGAGCGMLGIKFSGRCDSG